MTSKRSPEMASARIRQRTKARQSAARKAGIRKAPRKILHGKLLQLPSSPRTTVKRRGQHGPVQSSPTSRPKQVKTRSLVICRQPSSPHVCFQCTLMSACWVTAELERRVITHLLAHGSAAPVLRVVSSRNDCSRASAAGQTHGGNSASDHRDHRCRATACGSRDTGRGPDPAQGASQPRNRHAGLGRPCHSASLRACGSTEQWMYMLACAAVHVQSFATVGVRSANTRQWAGNAQSMGVAGIAGDWTFFNRRYSRFAGWRHLANTSARRRVRSLVARRHRDGSAGAAATVGGAQPALQVRIAEQIRQRRSAAAEASQRPNAVLLAAAGANARRGMATSVREESAYVMDLQGQLSVPPIQ